MAEIVQFEDVVDSRLVKLNRIRTLKNKLDIALAVLSEADMKIARATKTIEDVKREMAKITRGE